VIIAAFITNLIRWMHLCFGICKYQNALTFACWNGSVTFHLQIQTFEASSRIQRVLREKREVNAGHRYLHFRLHFYFCYFFQLALHFRFVWFTLILDCWVPLITVCPLTCLHAIFFWLLLKLWVSSNKYMPPHCSRKIWMGAGNFSDGLLFSALCR
jgi:hypothetical protein